MRNMSTAEKSDRPEALATDTQTTIKPEKTRETEERKSPKLLGSVLREELKKTTNQSPQVVQIAYLLQSTLDAVSQIGARLRIFCRP